MARTWKQAFGGEEVFEANTGETAGLRVEGIRQGKRQAQVTFEVTPKPPLSKDDETQFTALLPQVLNYKVVCLGQGQNPTNKTPLILFKEA